MNYAEFLNTIPDLQTDICRAVFQENSDTIKIKKEKTALKNLKKIFEATLTIGIEKGFTAMTIRDLIHVSGLSNGALYACFSSKEEILTAALGQGRQVIRRYLIEAVEKEESYVDKLWAAVKTHLFLSENMNKWFFFSYMEARHLNPQEREKAIQSERYTEKMIREILKNGHKKGAFTDKDHSLGASMIKAMLQDWYLKRSKYAKRGTHVDEYAGFVISFISAFYVRPQGNST
jgi:AcrR family transcriptional regulator